MGGLSLLLALLTFIALASRFLFSMRNLTVSQIRHYLYTPLVHPDEPDSFLKLYFTSHEPAIYELAFSLLR